MRRGGTANALGGKYCQMVLYDLLMAHVPRIYIPDLVTGEMLLTGETAQRLGTVMRVRSGDRVLLFDGEGREFEGEVQTVSRGKVGLQAGALVREVAAPSLKVEVWCGLVRAQRMEWAIEKCTEAGVDVFRPLVTEYAARGEEVSPTRLERWRRIAVEAAEQSGRLYVPVVEQAERLGEMLESVQRTAAVMVVAAPGGASAVEVAERLRAAGRVVLVVGPEGGFSDQEMEMMRGRGVLALGLGRHILRTETAAVVGTAMLRAAAG